jgi:hypothetical protein
LGYACHGHYSHYKTIVYNKPSCFRRTLCLAHFAVRLASRQVTDVLWRGASAPWQAALHCIAMNIVRFSTPFPFCSGTLTRLTWDCRVLANKCSKTCLKRNAIVPVFFFSVFTCFRFTKGCVLIKQSTKNMIA